MDDSTAMWARNQRMRTARWIRNRRIGFWIGGLLLLWLVLGYRLTGHDVCFDCKTWVWFDRAGLGNPRGFHIEFLNTVSESPSAVCREFFPPGHVHRRVFGQSSNSWLFGGWVCCLGSGASNGFTARMSEDGFREFVLAQIASGSLTREQVAAVVSVPHDWRSLESHRTEFSIRESRADYASAIDTGARLIREYDRARGSPGGDWRMWPEK